MMYLGDYLVGSTVYFTWPTTDAAGASITRATNGTIRVYKNGSTTELASPGITDTEDFDSLTGVHHTAIDLTSGSDYTAGGEFAVVLVGATIDGETVNAPLAHFSIERYGSVYGARVWMVDDDAGTTDRYMVVFLKNGQPITTGISSPEIQVIKASDGTDLIGAIALTQIASTGLYKHDATTTARVTSGAAYVAKITATIDGATRPMFQPVGRDSV